MIVHYDYGMTTRLSPGQTITRRAGFATITLQATDTGTYTVTVAQGPHRPDGWSYAYTDLTVARSEATRAQTLFRRYGTADAIDTRRTQLTLTVRDQQARQARRMHDAALLDEAQAELDTLMTFGDQALLTQLRADLNV